MLQPHVIIKKWDNYMIEDDANGYSKEVHDESYRETIINNIKTFLIGIYLMIITLVFGCLVIIDSILFPIYIMIGIIINKSITFYLSKILLDSEWIHKPINDTFGGGGI